MLKSHGPFEATDEEALSCTSRIGLGLVSLRCPRDLLLFAYHGPEGGLFPIAFDFGAIAERLRELRWGELIPYELMLNPPELAKRLVGGDDHTTAYQSSGEDFG